MQVCRLHTDVGLGAAETFFCGAAKPLAAVGGTTISGTIMTGRQVTAPPSQQMRPFAVGKRRSITIPVTVKGSRALLKLYTDIEVEAVDPKVWYNIGLEPVIALVSLAQAFLNVSMRIHD